MKKTQPSLLETKQSTSQPPAQTPLLKSRSPTPPPVLNKSKKPLLIGLLFLSLLIFGGIGFLVYQKLNTPQPSSFKECINSQRFRIQESYPRVCVTNKGQRFREVLSEEQQKKLQPPDEITNLSRDEALRDWKIFRNNEYLFSFKYPPESTIDEAPVPTSNYTQVIVEGNNSFKVKATKNYPPGQTTYFMDTESVGTKTINTLIWTIFKLPIGFNDGHSTRATPLVAVQLEKNNILYTVTFPDQHNIENPQTQILSTFKFLPENCQPCPQFTPPVEGWCKDGTIIPSSMDECGCQSPPKCQRNGAT